MGCDPKLIKNENELSVQNMINITGEITEAGPPQDYLPMKH